MKSDKFAKTIDDEQLDQVAGGFMMPENPESSQIPAHVIEKIKNNPESSIADLGDDLPTKKPGNLDFKEHKPITKIY